MVERFVPLKSSFTRVFGPSTGGQDGGGATSGGSTDPSKVSKTVKDERLKYLTDRSAATGQDQSKRKSPFRDSPPLDPSSPQLGPHSDVNDDF